jgi:SPP1 gp7 family putative phage head morphogenesis protein
MPTPVPGSKITPIEASMIARVSGKAPAGTEWQGPGEPMKPLAPEKVKGRAFDYATGWNLNPRPRSEAGQVAITYETLRRVADPTRGGLDLMRMAIETRKDQMASQKWDLVARDRKLKPKTTEARIKELQRMLRRPDGVTLFQPWQRSLLEDHLCIDAATIYPRPTGTGIFLAEVVDGATIKRLLAEDGRVPLPPEPAFQQHLKGSTAANFTLEELIYAPFNIMPNRVYAMSRVEQAINIINLGLRRMLSQTSYYTHGNMPEAIITAPEGWDSDQVKAFQEHWDAVLEGNVETRRNGRWVPYGTTVATVTPPNLQDPIDEWLARVICWCFSLPPSALVKEVNRATAETSAETAKEEGLEPLKAWWKNVMDEVLERCLDAADFELAWNDEEVVDAGTKATTLSTYVAGGIMLRDEARERLGLEPLDGKKEDEEDGEGKPGAPAIGGAEVVQDTALNGAQVTSLLAIVTGVTGGQIPVDSARAMITAAFPALTQDQVNGIVDGLKNFKAEKPEPNLVAPGKDSGKPGEKPGTTQGEDRDSASGLPPAKTPADDEAEKVAKAVAMALEIIEKKKALRPIPRNRAAVRRAEKRILAAAKAYLVKVRKVVVAGLLDPVEKAAKADHPSIIQILATVPKAEREKLEKKLREELAAMSEDGAEQAIRQILLAAPDLDKELEAMLTQANEKGIAWAEKHAAKLVTNINATTEEGLRGLVTTAMEEGWSNDELAAHIEDGALFNEARAEMIARTETAFADVQGNLAGWAETGVVESKQWSVAQDEVCDDCVALDGQVVPLDGEFPGGDPPLHPNCFLPGTLVSAAGITKQTERWFEGEIVRLFIEGQDPLAVTPNHPILTRRGWVPAGELQEGDDLFRVADPGAFVLACDPEDHHVETRIEEVADALLVAGGVPAVSVPVTAEHFHGDGTPAKRSAL